MQGNSEIIAASILHWKDIFHKTRQH